MPLKHSSRVPGSMNYDVVGMHNSIGSYYLQNHVLRNEHKVFVYVPWGYSNHALALSVVDSVDVDNRIFKVDRKTRNWKVCQGFCATKKST